MISTLRGLGGGARWNSFPRFSFRGAVRKTILGTQQHLNSEIFFFGEIQFKGKKTFSDRLI